MPPAAPRTTAFTILCKLQEIEDEADRLRKSPAPLSHLILPFLPLTRAMSRLLTPTLTLHACGARICVYSDTSCPRPPSQLSHTHWPLVPATFIRGSAASVSASAPLHSGSSLHLLSIDRLGFSSQTYVAGFACAGSTADAQNALATGWRHDNDTNSVYSGCSVPNKSMSESRWSPGPAALASSPLNSLAALELAHPCHPLSLIGFICQIIKESSSYS